MKKYHQLVLNHNPAEGIYGDCYRTCIACLLECPPAMIPHFEGKGLPIEEVTKRIFTMVDGWVFENYRVKPFATAWQVDDIEYIYAFNKMNNKGIKYIITGDGGRGANHSVLADENGLLWDVHPTGKGLVGPCKPDGLYWVEVLSSS